MLMKARYALQEKHSRKQEKLADMRARVETEVDMPGNPTRLAPTRLAHGRCYIFHIQIFLRKSRLYGQNTWTSFANSRMSKIANTG
jgi:hypothetical protein